MRCSAFILLLLPAASVMASADRNDLMPAQEKLEWVRPKISLMEAGETEGGKFIGKIEGSGGPTNLRGPS